MLNFVVLGLLGMGTQELLIILAVVLLIFGGKKVPELMRGLGKGVKEFKDAKDGKNDSSDVEKK